MDFTDTGDERKWTSQVRNRVYALRGPPTRQENTDFLVHVYQARTDPILLNCSTEILRG
jgi:hypothetical protein